MADPGSSASGSVSTTTPTLSSFPPIPRAGRITVAESHSELHAMPSSPDNPATGRAFCPGIGQYTAVDGHQLTSRLPFKIPSVRITSSRAASFIVAKDQSVPKALWDSWWEEGLRGVHSCLSTTADDDNLPSKWILKTLQTVTGVMVRLSETPSNLLALLFPHLQWNPEQIASNFSSVRRWPESWVRCLSWHPSQPYLALAMNDDSVRICVVGKDVVPMLRRQNQSNVTSLSWRPYVTSELAVGVDTGIVIWTTGMKPGKDRSKFLTTSGHAPVTNVEYSSDGGYLLSSSARDTSVLIWDANLWTRFPLRRVAGGGIPLSMWSPKGNRILTASPHKTFWIWEQKNNSSWNWKRWDTPKMRVEAAAWDPEGSTLIFAAGGYLYGLFFELSPVDQFVAGRDALVKCVFNVEETHKMDEEGNLEYKVGGRVRDIKWDPSGHRLAVMWDDSEMVGIFRVLLGKSGGGGRGKELLAPLGFVRGHPDECPMGIDFQREFGEGACLTVCWSSGRIQHLPLIFALPSDKKNILHEDHYRAQHLVHGVPGAVYNGAGFVSPRLSAGGGGGMGGGLGGIMEGQRLFGMDEEEATSPSRLYSIPTFPTND